MNLLKWVCVYGILSKGPVERRLCCVGSAQSAVEGGRTSQPQCWHWHPPGLLSLPVNKTETTYKQKHPALWDASQVEC